MILLQHIVMWLIGGTIYSVIELIYRGYTHWTMFILGGICFVACGLLDEIPEHPPPFWVQCILGALIITILEYFTGVVVNKWLCWGVWDYSNMPFNLHGQICLSFSTAWIFLAAIAIKLENFLHHILQKTHTNTQSKKKKE